MHRFYLSAFKIEINYFFILLFLTEAERAIGVHESQEGNPPAKRRRVVTLDEEDEPQVPSDEYFRHLKDNEEFKDLYPSLYQDKWMNIKDFKTKGRIRDVFNFRLLSLDLDHLSQVSHRLTLCFMARKMRLKLMSHISVAVGYHVIVQPIVQFYS